MIMANKKSTGRRGNNEGTIYQRPDGLWTAQVTIGYAENGKIRRKTVYGKSRAEVAMKMNALVGDIYKRGYQNSTNDDLETLMRHWLMIYKKPDVASRTFELIMINCRLYIFPELGRFKLTEITPDTVQTLLVRLLEKKKLCVDTVKKCRSILSQFLEYAMDNKYITFNPVSKTVIKARDRDKSKEKEYKAIRKEDRAAFIEAISVHPFWKPLCLTAMFCGLRIGEILALKWRNIDFAKEVISIENAITQVITFDENGKATGRKTIIGDTKTAASERENPIPDIVIKALKQYRDRRKLEDALLDNGATLTKPNDLIFSTNDGQLRTYWGTHTLFTRFLEKHGLSDKGIHFHTMRHTFSSMLFEIGENPKVIQALMGHKEVTTTMIYNNIDKKQVKQAKSVLDKLSSDYEM
jgi:integrase